VRILDERRELNKALIRNFHKLVMEGNIVIPNKPEFQDLIKELNGLKGLTFEECVDYIETHQLLRTLCIAVFPVEEKGTE
jgi:hypothetical protein